MTKTNVVAGVFVTLAVVLAFLVGMAPMPADVKPLMIQVIDIAVLHIGVAVLFLMALKGFRFRTKVAYW